MSEPAFAPDFSCTELTLFAAGALGPGATALEAQAAVTTAIEARAIKSFITVFITQHGP